MRTFYFLTVTEPLSSRLIEHSPQLSSLISSRVRGLILKPQSEICLWSVLYVVSIKNQPQSDIEKETGNQTFTQQSIFAYKILLTDRDRQLSQNFFFYPYYRSFNFSIFFYFSSSLYFPQQIVSFRMLFLEEGN